MTIRGFCKPLLLTLLLVPALCPCAAQAQELEWVKSTGGSSVATFPGSSVATDPRGNSFVAGSYVGTPTFGAGEPNETVLPDGGIGDIFVAKLAPDGRLLWATSAGGLGSDGGFGISADPRGNSFIAGSFEFAADFGAGETNETTLTAVESSDIFVAKFAPDGRVVWAKSAGGPGRDGVSAIATDPRGNSYVTGSFQLAATFGAGEANEITLTAVGSSDIFVAKFAPDGRLLWTKSAGGHDLFSWGTGIAVDAGGNSYVSCNSYVESALTFGMGEANETELGSGICFAKYGADGHLLWAKNVVRIPEGEAFSEDISIDARGNGYITGHHQSSGGIFGAGEANETRLGGGDSNGFIAKYASDGHFLWVKAAPRSDHFSVSEARGRSVAANPQGISYMTGSLFGTVVFGSGETNETTLTAEEDTTAIFIAKHAQDGRLLWVRSPAVGGEGLALDSRGNIYSIGGGVLAKYADRPGRGRRR